jgi:hypothetical protein
VKSKRLLSSRTASGYCLTSSITFAPVAVVSSVITCEYDHASAAARPGPAADVEGVGCGVHPYKATNELNTAVRTRAGGVSARMCGQFYIARLTSLSALT